MQFFRNKGEQNLIAKLQSKVESAGGREMFNRYPTGRSSVFYTRAVRLSSAVISCKAAEASAILLSVFLLSPFSL